MCNAFVEQPVFSKQFVVDQFKDCGLGGFLIVFTAAGTNVFYEPEFSVDFASQVPY